MTVSASTWRKTRRPFSYFVPPSPKMALQRNFSLSYFPYLSIPKPLFRKFHLIAINNFLLKQSMLITDAIPCPGRFNEARESRNRQLIVRALRFRSPASVSISSNSQDQFLIPSVHVTTSSIPKFIKFCLNNLPNKNSIER